MNEKKMLDDALEAAREEARRYDGGKLRWDLIDWRCVKEVVKVYTFGAVKYDDNNWRKGMEWSRVWASLQRHLYSFWAEREMYDNESGVHHLAHAAWNCLTLMWYSWFRRDPDLDDRPELCTSANMPVELENGMPLEFPEDNNVVHQKSCGSGCHRVDDMADR